MSAFEKIVSGGQTGVDRAALDVALELGIPCGGWCPKGRRAEDGSIPERYPLRETTSDDYWSRTLKNVHDSDGTLILHRGPLKGGTALTLKYAQQMVKPYLVVDLEGEPEGEAVRNWGAIYGIRVVNVAGPRESEAPGIHDAAVSFLREAFGERIE